MGLAESYDSPVRWENSMVRGCQSLGDGADIERARQPPGNPHDGTGHRGPAVCRPPAQRYRAKCAFDLRPHSQPERGLPLQPGRGCRIRLCGDAADFDRVLRHIKTSCIIIIGQGHKNAE